MSVATTSNYKILFYDIETSPNLGWIWGKWEQNAMGFESEWYILSFSYKFAGEKKIHTYSLPDFKGYDKDPENDKEICAKLWEIMDSADLVVGHNSDNFDNKKASARFFFHNFPPPSPYKTVDTLKIARRHFAFTSNKLTDLCQHLGIGKKVKTGGFDLWLGCINGDAKSWALMRKYNAMDITLLEGLYERLKCWATNHPNINLQASKDHQCPVCASTKTVRRGWSNLISYRAERWRCSDCGKWSQGKREKIKSQLLKA